VINFSLIFSLIIILAVVSSAVSFLIRFLKKREMEKDGEENMLYFSKPEQRSFRRDGFADYRIQFNNHPPEKTE